MKLIKSSAELINEQDPFKKIELAGRTCYKSEDKITDDSALKFTFGLIRSAHTAMVEHAAFVFDVTEYLRDDFYVKLMNLLTTPYINVTQTDLAAGKTRRHNFTPPTSKTRYLVSANARALNDWAVLEPLLACLQRTYPNLVFGKFVTSEYTGKKNWVKRDEIDLPYGIQLIDLENCFELTEEEVCAHAFFTFRFVTDRGVTHEMVRHRPASYAQESTRYVNYGAEQLNNTDGILFIEPAGFESWSWWAKWRFKRALSLAEKFYNILIRLKFKPQQARAVLPNALKTEIVMTASYGEWKHFFNLRYFGTTGAPHPDIRVIAEKAYHVVSEELLCFNLPDENM